MPWARVELQGVGGARQQTGCHHLPQPHATNPRSGAEVPWARIELRPWAGCTSSQLNMANGPEYACFKYPVGVAYVCSVGDEYLPAQRDDPVEAKSEGRDRPLCAPPYSWRITCNITVTCHYEVRLHLSRAELAVTGL